MGSQHCCSLIKPRAQIQPAGPLHSLSHSRLARVEAEGLASIRWAISLAICHLPRIPCLLAMLPMFLPQYRASSTNRNVGSLLKAVRICPCLASHPSYLHLSSCNTATAPVSGGTTSRKGYLRGDSPGTLWIPTTLSALSPLCDPPYPGLAPWSLVYSLHMLCCSWDGKTKQE